MAAPEAEAQETVFRTTGPPTDSEPRPFPPSSRKFPFESAAADSIEDWAVAAEDHLKGSEEDDEWERPAPGLGSAGPRLGCVRAEGRVGWRGGAPVLLTSALHFQGPAKPPGHDGKC